MKKMIPFLACAVVVACFTSGCLVINVEKNESPKKPQTHDAKEINVDETAAGSEAK